MFDSVFSTAGLLSSYPSLFIGLCARVYPHSAYLFARLVVPFVASLVCTALFNNGGFRVVFRVGLVFRSHSVLLVFVCDAPMFSLNVCALMPLASLRVIRRLVCSSLNYCACFELFTCSRLACSCLFFLRFGSRV